LKITAIGTGVKLGYAPAGGSRMVAPVLGSLVPGAAARHRRKTVLRLLAARLNGLGPKFVARHDVVVGPDGCGVALLDSDHSDSPRHLDLAFARSFQHPETSIYDCVQAPGATDEESWGHAVDLWAATTAVAVIESLAMNRQYAAHVNAAAENGFAGWHAVLGGIMGWGLDDPDRLPAWIQHHALLPILAPELTGDLDRPEYNGIKIFFGGQGDGETAEVRVNNRVHRQASEALLALDWPRSRDYVRTFVLLLHPQAPQPVGPGA
jgi:hypothetical protein